MINRRSDEWLHWIRCLLGVVIMFHMYLWRLKQVKSMDAIPSNIQQLILRATKLAQSVESLQCDHLSAMGLIRCYIDGERQHVLVSVFFNWRFSKIRPSISKNLGLTITYFCVYIHTPRTCIFSLILSSNRFFLSITIPALGFPTSRPIFTQAGKIPAGSIGF